MIIIGSAAMLLFSPSAAWAGSGHDDYDRHRAHGQYESHSAQFHHASHKKHHRVSHKRSHQPGKRRGHQKHHVGYYCRSCDRHFDARVGLYDHVAYRHRVPYRNLEIAVSFGEFGWIFFGG
jgi:hypothetical protein